MPKAFPKVRRSNSITIAAEDKESLSRMSLRQAAMVSLGLVLACTSFYNFRQLASIKSFLLVGDLTLSSMEKDDGSSNNATTNTTNTTSTTTWIKNLHRNYSKNNNHRQVFRLDQRFEDAAGNLTLPLLEVQNGTAQSDPWQNNLTTSIPNLTQEPTWNSTTSEFKQVLPSHATILPKHLNQTTDSKASHMLENHTVYILHPRANHGTENQVTRVLDPMQDSTTLKSQNLTTITTNFAFANNSTKTNKTQTSIKPKVQKNSTWINNNDTGIETSRQHMPVNFTSTPLNYSQTYKRITPMHGANTTTNHSTAVDYNLLYFPHNHTPLRNATEKLPSWLTDYLEWHRQQRMQLTQDNWQNGSIGFLVAVALKGQKSGGMTDRIRPVASYLRLAAQTQRMLMIYWERPFALEEFLLPPLGGLDWRVPSYMVESVRKQYPRGSNWAPIEAAARDNQTKLVTATYQSWNYGDLWYKEQLHENEPHLNEIFRDIWRIIFTPSPPVAQRIYRSFDRMGLRPGEFATAHIRALYAVKDRPREEIEKMARNAMNCVSNLRPGGPFFVASDSAVAIQAAIAVGAEHNVSVVTAQHQGQPLHVGLHDESDASVTPASFYDGFVDLYLMQFTRCSAVGPGGFAQWGQWLGYNKTCSINHMGRKSRTCQWMDTPSENDPTPGYASQEERFRRQLQAKNETPRFFAHVLLAASARR